jgi:hypothetical protein
MNKGLLLCAGVAAWMAALNGAGQDATAKTADAAIALPGVIANFITAGAADPKGRIPVIDAVPGAGVQNIAIASPLGILQHGRIYTVIVTSQNNTFRGVCTDSYVLKRGAAILASGRIHTYDCRPGTYWEWAANTPAIPNKPGPATLTGTVAYAGKTATTTATVLIK